MNSSRRHFLKRSIQTAVAIPALVSLGLTPPRSFAAETTENRKIKFRLGVASFTFRNFDRARTLEMTRRADLEAICFKDMHLPMDSTDEQCAAIAEETRRAGLDLYACGVVHMRSPAEVTNAFRYAKAAGMGTIVANPQPALLPLIEEKVKETDIYIAIHNHVSGGGIYPTPEAIIKRVGALDKRIGICVDVGHAVRNGADLVKSIHNCKERIYDIHLKDVTEASLQGRECICGRGVLDIPGCLQALIDIGYDRVVAFEYEVNASEPMPGLMESVGYVRGVLRMIGE